MMVVLDMPCCGASPFNDDGSYNERHGWGLDWRCKNCGKKRHLTWRQRIARLLRDAANRLDHG